MEDAFDVAFDAELIGGGTAIFENQWEGSLLFSRAKLPAVPF